MKSGHAIGTALVRVIKWTDFFNRNDFTHHTSLKSSKYTPYIRISS